MRPNSPLAVILTSAAALLATAAAAQATPLEKVTIVWEGLRAEGRARVLAPDDFLAQARAGTLRRLELEVGPGPLREAVERAHQARTAFELTIQPKKNEHMRIIMTDCLISSYPVSAGGGIARVGLKIRQVRFHAQGEPARGGAGDITTTPGGVPDRPDPGGPDQGAIALSPKPDLRIRLARQKAGAPNTLEVEVYNHGPGPAGATAVKVFFHKKNAVQTASGPVPGLAPGQIVWVAVALPSPFAAADHLEARVDDPNKVPETNELNNGFVVVE
jgi:hypothetical protein